MAGQDDWMILEDAIYQLISMQMAPTNPTGVLAVQPNFNGSTGIQLLTRIAPPEQQIFPCIGVMCLRFGEDPSAISTHDIVGTFIVTVSTKAASDPTIADTGNAALQNLRNYQNDGAGNGLSPLLRMNSTLFGLCQWSKIATMERMVLKSEADSADAIATAIYTFETHSQVRTQ